MARSFRVLPGHDHAVAVWTFNQVGCRPFLINHAVGVINHDGLLIGAFIFSGYNGWDAELSLYSPRILSRALVREIAVFALKVLQVHRLTVKTRNAGLIRGLPKIGAVYEAALHGYYGEDLLPENTAHQFVFRRRTLEILAKLDHSNH